MKNIKIEDYWLEYLPLKYVTKFPLKEMKEIPNTVKSNKHQTDEYLIEIFYKPISKI